MPGAGHSRRRKAFRRKGGKGSGKMKAGLQCIEWRGKEGAVFMNYVGVDIHKKYSVLCAVDEVGKKVGEGRVEGNSEKGFARFFAGLEGPSKAVLEACWNWGLIHDLLEEIEEVEEVVL